MTEKNKLVLTVQGSDGSGKGHLISAIAHKLKELGVENVRIQLADTHNKKKLNKDDLSLSERLKQCEITILEQQT